MSPRISVLQPQKLWSSLIDGPVDKHGVQFPIIGGGITSSVPLLLAFGLAIHILLPFWMQKRSPIDVRPFMLIWSGVLFGINGAGFMITLTLTGMGRETMQCRRNIEDFKYSVIVYSGYAYFLVKFLDFGRIVFAVLRKKDQQISVLHFLQSCLLILLIQSGIYFHPGGVGYFIGAVDTFVGCFINSYYILSTAKYFRDPSLWKGRLVRLQAAAYAALLVHAIVFLMNPQCEAPKLVLTIQAAYGGLSLLFFLHKYSQLMIPFSHSDEKESQGCDKKFSRYGR